MNTKVIKQKMKSVGSIKKITRTMEMVSVAKMRKAIIESTLLKPFALEIKKTLDELGPQLAESNYVKTNNAIDKILIIVASNKGLCGAYNSNVYKFSNKLNDEEKFTKAICYGKFAEKIAKKLKLEIILSVSGRNANDSDIRNTVKIITEEYYTNRVSKVFAVYTEFMKAGIYYANNLQILPYNKVDSKIIVSEFTFEPNKKEVANKLIPIALQNTIKRIILDSYASEHSARMFAMKQATDNAGEMLSDLKLYYNQARQAKVTQEIAEIVGGSMALDAS